MAAILGVLAKAFAFMGIIVLGYTLKKIHVFKPEDFYVLSKIVIRITPAVCDHQQFQQDQHGYVYADPVRHRYRLQLNLCGNWLWYKPEKIW